MDSAPPPTGSFRNIPMPAPGRLDAEGVIETFAHRMMYSIAKDRHTASDRDVFLGLSVAIRDRLMERWFRTQDAYYRQDAKRVYYLSLEFLMGRAMRANLINLGALDSHREAMARLGFRFEEIEAIEEDAGLGNGGLGRLAACFLDSAATLGLPFYGYGIRYEFGIFRQAIKDGEQVESPDQWLRYPNPWEIPRPDTIYPVKFYGAVEPYRDAAGLERIAWVDAEEVMAMAYDMPVAGYGNGTVNTLRLWSARSTREFDFAHFRSGDYLLAVKDKYESEYISKVLYPPDESVAGKELRLKQQYFFVSATLRDVIRRFKKRGRAWSQLADKVAIQLNDTHPTLVIPELMRILVDEELVPWDEAWELTRAATAYTNHTVLPEALETWSTEMVEKLLPRHFSIIEEIDRRHRVQVAAAWPGDAAAESKLAIVEAGAVRMAHLAVVGSHSVNGVAALHTEILRRRTFPEFDRLFPGRFQSKTNGITPRRWLFGANPALASLVTEAIGDGWIRDLDQLRRLQPFAEDGQFRERFRRVRRQNKLRLVELVERETGLRIDPEGIFDCQVKRIHEYKRQLLCAMHVLALVEWARAGGKIEVPRTVIFAGKAAPTYVAAKRIIRLIHAIGKLAANEPALEGRLQVVFLPNYGVTMAETLFPACDLSEQISTAGWEASGTGNMKAALSGALTIGTLDGANVEIREEVGADNIFIFGHSADEVVALKAAGYDPSAWIENHPLLARVVERLESDELSPGDPEAFWPIAEMLRNEDRYLHCADFGSYLERQRQVEAVYRDVELWTRKSIANVAGSGKFSSDRTVAEYARDIWGVTSVVV